MSDRHSYADVVSGIADQTAPTSAEIRELRLRLQPAPVRSRTQPRPWWELPAIMAIASACVLAVIVLSSPWIERHRSTDASMALASSSPTELEVSSLVSLVHNGTGLMEGTIDDLSILWEQGLIDIDVVPKRGVAVAIETSEAYVHVIGTHLTIARFDLATSVSVEHGLVAVQCLDHLGASAPIVQIGPREELTCEGTDPSKVLRHAVSLRSEGADPARILALLERGLTRSEDGPLHFELVAASIGPLIDLGRTEEALAAIDRYLTAGDLPRSDRFRALAEKLRADGSLPE